MFSLTLLKRDETEKLIKEIEKDYSKLKKAGKYSEYESMAFKKTIRDKIDELVEVITKNKRLIISIDEIDRCQKEFIVRSLDAVRIFLGRNKCIFLLAYDEKIVEDAVKQKSISG